MAAAGGPGLRAAAARRTAWRVAQLAQRYAIDADEARRRIERTDDARARFQKHYFDSDIYDCRQYDLVLNTESLGRRGGRGDHADAAARRAAEGASRSAPPQRRPRVQGTPSAART